MMVMAGAGLSTSSGPQAAISLTSLGRWFSLRTYTANGKAEYPDNISKPSGVDGGLGDVDLHSVGKRLGAAVAEYDIAKCEVFSLGFMICRK